MDKDKLQEFVMQLKYEKVEAFCKKLNYLRVAFRYIIKKSF